MVPALQGIDGVSTVDLTGGPTPILDIVLDPAAMAETGISLQQVQGLLFANQITIPSGAIDEAGLRLPVSTAHEFTSVEALESLIVGARTPSARRSRRLARRPKRRPRTRTPAEDGVGRPLRACPTSAAWPRRWRRSRSR